MPNAKVTKALQKRSDSAVEAFHAYYSSAANWGPERWNLTLYPALSKPTRYCTVINQYVPNEEVNKAFAAAGIAQAELQELYSLTQKHSSEETASSFSCLERVRENSRQETNEKVLHGSKAMPDFPAPRRAENENGSLRLLTHWNMDAASALAALCLDVRPGHQVLDLCAAPGGKSVVLAQLLWPELHAKSPNDKRDLLADEGSKSSLHSNEYNKIRYQGLIDNLKSYLPAQLHEERKAKVLNIDASTKNAASETPLGEGGYDRVLVDAPCSSERHIIHAYLKATAAGQIADEMANWKSSHSKSLARVQVALLMTALRAVKIGGRVVYATCSLATEENDNVIERTIEAVKRERKKQAETSGCRWDIHIVNQNHDLRTDTSNETQLFYQNQADLMAEPTRYGRIVLPDHASRGQWGPLYFCVLEKKERPKKKKSIHPTIQNSEHLSD